MSSPAVVLENITKSYADGAERIDVLRGADLAVERGEFLAILGSSGSGKSTLLHIAGGLDRQFGGKASVAGRELNGLGDTELSAFRARTVGFVFQAFNLLSGLSALQNVLLPSFFGAVAADEQERAREALGRVGLGGKVNRRPGELSGGERQRVALARALFTRPPVLLADEPTGNLDAATGAEIIGLLQTLNREDGTTLIIVTHEERVSNVAGRVVRLREGKLVEA